MKGVKRVIGNVLNKLKSLLIKQKGLYHTKCGGKVVMVELGCVTIEFECLKCGKIWSVTSDRSDIKGSMPAMLEGKVHSPSYWQT